MKTILVSGASGIVGYGILRSLRKANEPLRLIGTSIYENTPAEAFSDVFEKAPLTSDDGYIGWLVDTVKKHNVDMIVPGIEPDLHRWTESASDIEETGTMALVNNPELVLACRDKWDFFTVLKGLEPALAIESTLETGYEDLVARFGTPFLLKPRRGFGAKGILRVDDLATFEKSRESIGSILMAQPIVGTDDEEFSTSAFCDGNGGNYARMTLKRRLSKDGYTESAEVVSPEDIDLAIGTLCTHFKPLGPTNFQFRRHGGSLKLLEINPRISSATSIRTAFGYNESAMAVGFFLDKKVPSQPEIKAGKAIRFVDDFVTFK